MRISDWSSDVCSSDLDAPILGLNRNDLPPHPTAFATAIFLNEIGEPAQKIVKLLFRPSGQSEAGKIGRVSPPVCREHTCRGPMLRTMQRHEGPNPIERQWRNRWVQGLRVKPRRLFEIGRASCRERVCPYG